MFIDQLTNADAMPTLEASMRFAGARQRLIAHNIANLTTPRFQPIDVSVDKFRAQLADAVDRRRERFGGHRGDLEIKSTREVRADRDGRLTLRPREAGRNILFHDRNNRDLERTMQDLVENVAQFRVASELLRSRVNVLNAAISERV